MSYFPVMEEKTQGYKYLLVWQIAMELVPQVYRLTRKFPSDELYGITSQLRRAMVSVPANIAEGQGRAHQKEFVHFLSIARGSLAEVDTLMITAFKLGFVDEPSLSKIDSQIVMIRKLLQKLMKSQTSKFTPDPRPPTPDVEHP
jgi:four helix bundle protein